jgi:hypothetical protein
MALLAAAWWDFSLVLLEELHWLFLLGALMAVFHLARVLQDRSGTMVSISCVAGKCSGGVRRMGSTAQITAR